MDHIGIDVHKKESNLEAAPSAARSTQRDYSRVGVNSALVSRRPTTAAQLERRGPPRI
jgi:hypothetical protein